ncbi:MAG TPA: hypothetical protein VHC67_12535 [Gaiellaceae bacterium]|nr:hypothetical protein [Gaiellaceae bacterium]
MRNRSVLCSTLLAAAAAFLALGAGAHRAAAQAAALGDGSAEGDEEEGNPPPAPATETTKPMKTQIGVALRLRNVRIPKSILEAFVERAPAGSSNFGIGLELSRRKDNFEFQFGLEYEKIYIPTGEWIDKGDMIPQDETDYVMFENFGWVTAEATFLHYTPIIPQLALRYGGGAGIGVFFGDVARTDHVCTSSSIDSCHEKPNAENVDTPYENIPPVFLVVNAFFGLQIKPTDKLFINVEGGLRTMPFFGTSLGYYF